MKYDAALAELYQAPLEQFIAERKRLVGELKAAGDKTGARVLGTRAKPPVSAWVTNQLWWHARDAFDDLMKSADKLRKGQLAASGEHRDAIAKLRKRATAMLEQAGHGATESTLRRVATTLSAIAASGTWDPDEPGTLSTDRDPPGFEAVGIPSGPIDAPPPKPEPKHEKPHKPAKHDKHAEKSSKDELEELRERKRAEEQAEKKRAEDEKKRINAEKHRLESALRTAKAELHDRERDAKQLEKQLHAATEKVSDAQEVVDEIEKQLGELRGS
ncbi:MAG TPA: hypothetical protein VMZ53_08430 [Kofleriaceae bacterium]|nr:hypothetical protein [Kofleriaceae bacterium]